ncbi:MAG: hypothetical protein ACK2UI_01305 [Anaerolineae bacterium]
MILLNDMTFEQRAKFLFDSICAYPESPEFDAALSEHTDALADIDFADGLRAHHDLMQQMYTDIAFIKGKDDQAKYLELIATMWFLYAVFGFGMLAREGESFNVIVDKDVLKQQYKKGSFNKRQRHLERLGFSLRYLSAEGERQSLSRASQLSLSYDRDTNLIPVVKHFAENIVAFEGNALEKKAGTVQYNKLSMFLKADYETAFLHTPIPRDTLDPLRYDLVATISAYRQEWEGLVDKLRDQCDLHCSGFWTYGGVPAWSVSFAAKSKPPLAIFTLGSDIVFIEFTLPLDVAERIIQARKTYSDPIREQIEAFRCINCPKQCKGSNLTKIDGVWLCDGRAEARRIYTKLSTPEDFASLHTMVDMTC